MAPSEASPTVGDATNLSSKLRSLHAFAVSMGKDEDLTIFRRFDEVNVLNLLLLQDEVETLTKEFKKTIPKTPERQTGASSGYLASYRLGEQAVRASEDPNSDFEVNGTKSALLEVAQIKALDLPDMQNITSLHGQVARLRNSALPKVATEDMSYWNEENNDDFVILRTEAVKAGRLNIWLKFVFWLVKWHMGDFKQTQTNANGEGIVTIVIMTKFEGTNVSLITTSVSVVVFSLVMAFGATDSTGKDVLAATAAYTAVLVVFIGTSLAGTGSSGSQAGPA